jgi:hypothetical protein
MTVRMELHDVASVTLELSHHKGFSVTRMTFNHTDGSTTYVPIFHDSGELKFERLADVSYTQAIPPAL